MLSIGNFSTKNDCNVETEMLQVTYQPITSSFFVVMIERMLLRIYRGNKKRIF